MAEKKRDRDLERIEAERLEKIDDLQLRLAFLKAGSPYEKPTITELEEKHGN